MGEEQSGAVKQVPLKAQAATTKPIKDESDTPAWPKPTIATPNLQLPTPNMSSSDAPKREWNTSKLGLRVGVDAMAAGSAGVLVAPIITMIDKGIIENASGRNTLKESLKKTAREMLTRPHRFVGSKPFVLIFVRPPTLTHPSKSPFSPY